MESNPLVSILIPNYNKAPYLRETLDSVLAQTYTNWECIVVDDHSTDNSLEILEKFAQKDTRFKIYKRPENRKAGGNAARNYAFELSKGDYINWLDSDDIINTIFLEEKINKLKENPSLDFVLSDIYIFVDDLNNAKSVYEFESKQIELSGFEDGRYVFQTSMPAYKRSFLDNLTYLFDEDLLVAQDLEFQNRVLLNSKNFNLNKESILFWRQTAGSKTNIYQADSFAIKYQKSYMAYKMIFINKKQNGEIEKEKYHFFQNVFNDMLFHLPFNSAQFWDLLFFGTKNNLFKGRFQGLKIVGIKVLKNMNLI